MSGILADKVILITGASSGIGRATAVELASQGAAVALLARNKDALIETSGLLGNADYLMVPCDLGELSTIPEVVDAIMNWRGRLDGVAFCAGIGGRFRLRDTKPEAMEKLMTLNCFSFVELMRAIARKKPAYLQALAVSSMAALGHDKYFTAYAASKAALEAAAKTLATELLSKKILINILRCAFVATPMVLGAADPLGDFEEKLEASGYQPLGLIPPEAAARMIAFMLGPGASYSTGTIFTINAGAACP